MRESRSSVSSPDALALALGCALSECEAAVLRSGAAASVSNEARLTENRGLPSLLSSARLLCLVLQYCEQQQAVYIQKQTGPLVWCGRRCRDGVCSLATTPLHGRAQTTVGRFWRQRFWLWLVDQPWVLKTIISFKNNNIYHISETRYSTVPYSTLTIYHGITTTDSRQTSQSFPRSARTLHAFQAPQDMCG